MTLVDFEKTMPLMQPETSWPQISKTEHSLIALYEQEPFL